MANLEREECETAEGGTSVNFFLVDSTRREKGADPMKTNVVMTSA